MKKKGAILTCCTVVQRFSWLRMGLFFEGGAELLLLFSVISPNFGPGGSNFWGGSMLFLEVLKKIGHRKTHEV